MRTYSWANTGSGNGLLSIFHSVDDEFILAITRTTRTPAFWDIPRCAVITHTSDSHQIPSQNKTKIKATKFKNLPKIQILKFWQKLYTWHTFWSSLIRCGSNQNCRHYRADTRCGTDGRTDGRTDGWTDGVKPIYTPNNSFVRGV